MNGWDKKQSGFTIVELTVIIVVIGILSTIGVFAYNNITQSTRDAERRTGATTLSTALTSWARRNNQPPTETSAGDSGNGWGWIYNDAYTENIETVLLDSEFLNEPVVTPGAPDGTNGYAFFPCHQNDDTNQFYGVFAQLEAPRDADDATIDRWQEGEGGSACTSTPLDAPYNMNYVKTFHFRL